MSGVLNCTASPKGQLWMQINNTAGSSLGALPESALGTSIADVDANDSLSALVRVVLALVGAGLRWVAPVLSAVARVVAKGLGVVLVSCADAGAGACRAMGMTSG